MAATTSVGAPRPTAAAGATLQQFADAAVQADGVTVGTLGPIAEFEVHTRNTTYRITTVGAADGRILIQGGRFFPVPCEVRLNGGTLGGSVLKVGWIGRGFCMELLHDGRRITTTRVREIRSIDPATAPRH